MERELGADLDLLDSLDALGREERGRLLGGVTGRGILVSRAPTDPFSSLFPEVRMPTKFAALNTN